MSGYDVAQDSHIGVWTCRFRRCAYAVHVSASEEFVTDGRACRIALPSVLEHMEREHGDDPELGDLVRKWVPLLRPYCEDPELLFGPDRLIDVQRDREIEFGVWGDAT